MYTLKTLKATFDVFALKSELAIEHSMQNKCVHDGICAIYVYPYARVHVECTKSELTNIALKLMLLLENLTYRVLRE